MYINYTGIVDITPEVQLVLGRKEGAKTTEFGNACKLDPLSSL